MCFDYSYFGVSVYAVSAGIAWFCCVLGFLFCILARQWFCYIMTVGFDLFVVSMSCGVVVVCICCIQCLVVWLLFVFVVCVLFRGLLWCCGVMVIYWFCRFVALFRFVWFVFGVVLCCVGLSCFGFGGAGVVMCQVFDISVVGGVGVFLTR